MDNVEIERKALLDNAMAKIIRTLRKGNLDSSEALLLSIGCLLSGLVLTIAKRSPGTLREILTYLKEYESEARTD